MAITVGSVYVDILPSAAKFAGEAGREIDPVIEAIGKKIAEELGKAIGKGVSDGVEDGVSEADPQGEAAKQGEKTGGAFARTFKATLKAALNDLPEINLDADTKPALRNIAALRETISKLSAKVDVDVDAAKSMAELEKVRRELEFIAKNATDFDIKLDATQALAGVEALQAEFKRAFAKSSKDAGKFARDLNAKISAAIHTLPEIDLRANGGLAEAEIARIRTQLAAIRDVRIGIDIPVADAVAKVEALKAALDAISKRDGVKIPIRTDAASAVAELEAFLAQVQATTPTIEIKPHLETNEERFKVEFRAFVERISATAGQAIVGAYVNLDTSAARREFTDIMAEFDAAARAGVRIGIDIDEAQALAQLEDLKARLAALSTDDNDIQLKLATAGALAQLEAFMSRVAAERAEVPVDVKLGAFETELKAKLAALAASIRPIEIDADTSPAMAETELLRQRLAILSARIGVDVDTGAALAEIALIQAGLKELDGQQVDIDIDIDSARVLAQLAAIQAAANAIGNGDGPDNLATKMSRIRLILVAVLLLFPLIAGAIVALAGAISAVITPIAAVALGVDGIKKAVAPLQEQFNALRGTISNVFQAGLAPAIQNVAKLFPLLTTGLSETAFALSKVATQITAMVTSAENLKTMQASFDGINKLIVALEPSVAALFQNFIDFVKIGTDGIVGFGAEMTQVGETWAAVIERFKETGVGEAAVRALFQVLAELLGLLAPLTEFGAVMLQGFGPALAAALSVIAALFTTLSSALTALGPIGGPIVTTFILLQGTMLLLGKSFISTAAAGALARTAFTGVGVAAITVRASFTGMYASIVGSTTAMSVMGVAARAAAVPLATLGVVAKGVLAALGGPIGIAITAVVVALSFLGSAQGSAAQTTDEHRTAVESLSQALRDNGNAINSNIIAMKTQEFSQGAVADQLAKVGISAQEAATAVSQGGPAYDAFRQKLLDAASAGQVYDQGLDSSTNNMSESNTAALELVHTFDAARQTFVDAGKANQELAQALFQTGSSLATGVASAKLYEAATATLGDELKTAADKATALHDALIILSGGTLPLLEANAKLAQGIQEMGKALDDTKKKAEEGGGAFLNAGGDINVASQAGRDFVSAFSGAFSSMTQAATAAFEAAGGMNNLGQATADAKQKATDLRTAFVDDLVNKGLVPTRAAAELLADKLGLIPNNVAILISAKDIPIVQQDLEKIQAQIDRLKPGVSFTVGVLSAEAEKTIAALGFKVEHINGQVVITAEDKDAVKKYNDYIALITKGKPAAIPVTSDAKLLLDSLPTLRGSVTGQPPAGLPTKLDTTAVPKDIQNTQGQVTAAPAQVPTSLDTTKVQPQVADIQQTTLATVANMPVNIIKGSGWDADIAAIRDSVLLTVGAMPINIIKGSAWDADLAAIKASVALAPFAQIPFDAVVSVNFFTQITAIKASVFALAPIAQIPFDAVVSANFWIQITAIKTAVFALAPIAQIPFDAVVSANFWIQIDAIKAAVVALQPPASIPFDAVKSITFDATILAIRNSVSLVPLMIVVNADTTLAKTTLNTLFTQIKATVTFFKVTADTTLAINVILALLAAINATLTFFQVTADVSQAINTVNALIQAISQIIVPITVVAQFGGFVGGIGGAAGGVVTSRNTQSDFDAASAATQSLNGGSSFGSSPPSTGSGGGFHFNPGAVLDTGNITGLAVGAIVGMAAGAMNRLTPMSGKVAQVVSPNTWRVIGDRVTDDEAFIPINGSSRSQAILSQTAGLMGYGLHPMFDGAVATQQAGAFAPVAAGTSTAAQGQGSGTVSGSSGGNTYNFPTTNSAATAVELADEVMFRLRHQKTGGPNSGRR